MGAPYSSEAFGESVGVMFSVAFTVSSKSTPLSPARMRSFGTATTAHVPRVAQIHLEVANGAARRRTLFQMCLYNALEPETL